MDAYNQLIDVGYKQNDIDEMDILYHLQLLGRRKEESETDDVIYADDVFNSL